MVGGALRIMANSYLVTGGTGFLGSALVRRLVQQGHSVRVLDNNYRGRISRLDDVQDRIEFVEADIRDASAVDRAVEGIDVVVHLAFINGTRWFYSHPELVLDVGVRGMLNVLDACMKRGVGELVLASSSEVYQTPPRVPTDETVPLTIPDPHNPRYSYASGKLISEMLAINFGRKHFRRVVIFRPHNVYGPDMGFEHVIPQFVLRAKRLCSQQPDPSRPLVFPIQGTGRQRRAFIFIDDFIDGLSLVMERGEHLGIYHIGTDEEVSISRVAKMVGRYFKRKVIIQPGPPAEGGTLRRCPDIARIRALGFRPRYSLARGLVIAARWYDENSSLAPEGSY